MLAAEQIGIFLRGVAHAHSYRQLCEFFQHSLETVSRYFNQVLKAIVSLLDEFISLPSADVDCHPFVRANEQFHPFFKNAVGAIDGTHIPAVISTNLQNRYCNRKGFTSQNVMATVSFDRQFVYVASGWEGSAADMRVLRWAVEQGQFEVPRNKYFLVDSGYANTDRLIAPFRGYRYHLADYRERTTRRYAAEQELFNHCHAQLRNVVERTFGIWKEQFQVLTHMRQFPISVQAYIVIACAVMHNFIGRYHGHDLYFNMSQTEMQHDAETVEVDMPEDDPNLHATIGERIQGEAIRHNITIDLWNARIASQRNRSS
ncbi:putative nuclease HARBI1 [Dendrobium catenatum]|uniref:putative nuclease HARBI1 n=1 Tax=Dendrobium catenatum TaxID=906689 RepID=UPI00109F775B|nr:putative nuclease HARBI1 [Dendrobium catenatum]